MLKKDANAWDDKYQAALNKVKQIIVSELVLVHFDPKLQVVLTTDASAEGIGACLPHILPNFEDRPIVFASRTLSKAEEKLFNG